MITTPEAYCVMPPKGKGKAPAKSAKGKEREVPEDVAAEPDETANVNTTERVDLTSWNRDELLHVVDRIIPSATHSTMTQFGWTQTVILTQLIISSETTNILLASQMDTDEAKATIETSRATRAKCVQVPGPLPWLIY